MIRSISVDREAAIWPLIKQTTSRGLDLGKVTETVVEIILEFER